MKILILGGTVFLGRHLTEAALKQGHSVTHLNRGISNPNIFPEVETLLGDRNKPFSFSPSHYWDAIIDTSGFSPISFKALTDLLVDKTNYYVFISSRSVYENFTKHHITEEYPTQELSYYDQKLSEETYGGFKAECERIIRFYDSVNSLVIRSGLLIGPYDQSGRLSYWIRRMTNRLEVLSPGSKDKPVQVLDVRDLATWIIRMLEQRKGGVYNACGPLMSMQNFLHILHQSTQSESKLVWIPEEYLMKESDIRKNAFNIFTHSKIPMWVPNNYEGLMTIDSQKAIREGLEFRELSSTILDHPFFLSKKNIDHQQGYKNSMLSFKRETQIIQSWKNQCDLARKEHINNGHKL